MKGNCLSTVEQTMKVRYMYALGYNSTIRKKIKTFASKWMEQGKLLNIVTQMQKDECQMFSLQFLSLCLQM